MKQLRFLISVVVLAMLPLANAWADTLTGQDGVVYFFVSGSGKAIVAEGKMVESDPMPQSRVYDKTITVEDVVIREDFTIGSDRYEVQEIGFCAFACLSKILTVTIPRTIRVINENCFAGCTGIRDIYCYANPNKLKWKPSTLSYAPDFKADKATVCHVIAGYEEVYKQKFGDINVTFKGDLEGEMEPEDEDVITSDFINCNAVCDLLGAERSDRCWHMDKPEDGTEVSFFSNTYGGENALYFRVTGGSSSIKEFVMTSDFPVRGNVSKIQVRAAGGIHHIAYLMPNGQMVNSPVASGNGGFETVEIDFGGGIEVDGPVQFSLYSGTPLIIQSISLVMAGSTTAFKSTFNGWYESEPVAGVDKNGLMETVEGLNWTGVVDNQDVEVEFTQIGAAPGEGTTCIAAYRQSGEYNLHMISNFPYSGTVQKIIVHAAGNITGLSASIGERSGGEWYHSGAQAYSSNDFVDYVINCPDCPIYNDAMIQVQMHGEGVMFVHSITIVQNEVLEELPSGKCGDNLNWELVYIPGITTRHPDTNEEIPAMELIITGSGAMYDFADSWSLGNDKAPWFEYRYNIMNVQLPEGLTYIGDYAFAFYWNTSWYNPLPSTLKGVGISAFYNVFFANELRLPEGLTSVGAYAFKSLNGAHDIYVPKSLTQIGNQGLSGLYSAEYYHVDAENPVYSGDGFGLIEKATNTIIAGGLYTEIPDYVTIIADHAFESTYKESIHLPSGLQSIGYMSFYYGKLKEVEIPDQVETIGQEAFASCKQLLTVIIGKGVKSIGKAAFENSTNILDVYCYADPEVLRWESYSYDDKNFKPDRMTRFHVHAADLEKWKTKFGLLNVTFVGDLGSGIDVITDNKTVDVEALKTEDLTDNTVDNVYYNLNPAHGCGYIDGSLVIGQTTDMSQIGTGEPGSTEVAENFNGIILKVNGKGTITIDSRVFGNKIRLAVRIGNGTPTYASENSRWQTYISYNVDKETYVYIYAVGPGSLVRHAGSNAPEIGDDAVVIYGITVTPDASGIEEIANGQSANGNKVYDLSGRAVAIPRQKGIYIIDGKKVMMK